MKTTILDIIHMMSKMVGGNMDYGNYTSFKYNYMLLKKMH